MKTRLIGAALALGLATVPLASFAGGVGGGNANSNWTIYGWQNWAMDFRSVDMLVAVAGIPSGWKARRPTSVLRPLSIQVCQWPARR